MDGQKQQTSGGARVTFVTIMCPHCKHRQDIELPTGRGPVTHTCTQCARVVESRDRCCVLCVYGSRPCPHPEQQ